MLIVSVASLSMLNSHQHTIKALRHFRVTKWILLKQKRKSRGGNFEGYTQRIFHTRITGARKWQTKYSPNVVRWQWKIERSTNHHIMHIEHWLSVLHVVIYKSRVFFFHPLVFEAEHLFCLLEHTSARNTIGCWYRRIAWPSSLSRLWISCNFSHHIKWSKQLSIYRTIQVLSL